MTQQSVNPDNVLDHEVLSLFKTHVYPLSQKLSEMLNEHHSHQTERRGCGYTQATRVIAEYVNQVRDEQEFRDFNLFQNYPLQTLKSLFSESQEHALNLQSWRHLDQQSYLQDYIAQHKEDLFGQDLSKEISFQHALRHISAQSTLEESKIICDFIEDIILPKNTAQTGLTSLRTLVEKPKVGSCPMAEKFFLKIAHHQLLRAGILNIFVDDTGEPVMMEKVNMGDNHSCISLKPLLMNGVRLPAGSLFATAYDETALTKTPNKQYKGHVIPIAEIEFWFLRVTTLAISPANRERTFSTHFKQQVQNDLLDPQETLLTQLMDVAKAQC